MYVVHDGCSKNHQRALDTIQISLEAEARGRLEALRQRKKLEQDVLELEAALEATARARGEVEKNYKRFQQQIRDLELVVEEEQTAAQEARTDQAAVEKRVGLLNGQLEEVKGQLEATERAYKTAHAELAEALERANEMTTANAALQAAKRKLDTDIQSIHVSI